MKVKCVAEYQQQQNMLALATNDKQLSAQNAHSCARESGSKNAHNLEQETNKGLFLWGTWFSIHSAITVCVVFGGGGGGLHSG